jgi:type IV secretory pathway VirB10-like protein
MKLISTLFSGLLLCVATTTFAQWQWIDKDGRKVFSDRSPPAEIAEKNILKRPPGRNAPAQPQPADAPAAEGTALSTPLAPAAPAAAKPVGGVDKELEAKKKAAIAAEEAKKKAEDEKFAAARADNCNRAKLAKTTFDSGVRVSRTKANGEREVMDDAARNEESKRIQSIIDKDCK